MGNYFSTLGSRVMESFQSEKKISLLMNGLDAAGKTTILYKLKLDELVTTIPTIGFNVETVEFKNVQFTLWDIGGEDRIRSLWSHYYENRDALVYVVDSNDRERFDESFYEFRKMMEDHRMSRDIPVLMILNKRDLPNRISSEDFIKKFNLLEFFSSDRWYITEACAISGEGLEHSFSLLSSHLKGKPIPQWYHCRGYKLVKEIHKLGWKPIIHDLFPKKYRSHVWSLILISDRLGLSTDTMKIVLSYVQPEPENFEEMKKLTEFLHGNVEKFEEIPEIGRLMQKFGNKSSKLL